LIDFAICTIVSKNYLPFARVLAESFYEYNQGDVFVLLVDSVDGYFEPEKENFRLIEMKELKDMVPNFEKFCFQYTILELNTAIKPYFLEYLFKKYNLTKLVYFDPDILITNNLSEIARLLDEYPIILTPHLTAPYKDDYKPGEIDILMSGVYNLGFLALSNNSTIASLLSWWQDRLYNNCIHAVEKGLFVDQKWMDLVPGMHEGVFILKEPGYNVAYWNFHCRNVRVKKDKIYVNGKPSYFFHFSGLDPENMETVSKHQNRYTISMLKNIRPIFEMYRDRLFKNGYRECKNWPYFYGSFSNGAIIPDFIRRLYLSMGVNAKRFINPFIVGKNSYFAWLNERIDEANPTITRLMYEIYTVRQDVQEVFPDILGRDREAFVAWAVTGGKRDHNLDIRFFEDVLPTGSQTTLSKRIFFLKTINEIKKPLKKILNKLFWRSPKIMNRLKAFNTRLNVTLSMPTNTAIKQSMNLIRNKNDIGINIAGYITSESGTGEGVRSNIRIFETLDIRYVLNNIESSSRQSDDSFTSFSEDNPYSINLIHVNADQVPVFYSQKGKNFFNHKYNIGYWVWELSAFPEEWLPNFQYFDEIWTASNFCLESLSSVSPIPIVKISHCITIDTIKNVDRSYFGLKEDSFVFLYIFDFLSFSNRKNPLAVIEAFKKSFQLRKDALLVLKCSNSHCDPSFITKISNATEGLNIKIINKYLKKDELYALISLSDCYVSLHRSEGFGLTLAESMYLEKPVIATAYSGNMDFMNLNNSFLVKYKLIEIEKDVGPYKRGNVWADPDKEHAAELMDLVYQNRELSQQIGRTASRDIKTLFSPSAVGQRVKDRIEKIKYNF
jgi:glycosyltransferase involved in cell wall biosynthesis